MKLNYNETSSCHCPILYIHSKNQLSVYLYSAFKMSKRALSELRSRIAIEDDTHIIVSLMNLLQVPFEKSQLVITRIKDKMVNEKD